MTGCLQWLDAAATTGGGSSLDPGPGMGPRRSPEARRQGQKAPRVARREAPRLRKEGVPDRNVAPIGAPSPLACRAGEEGGGIRADPAPGKECGRRSVGCLTS